MGQRPATSTGFTIVELLLVMAIIGTLVALLAPAVQAAREAARRSTCTNNLKQIGVAISNYESAKKVYPPGAIWDPPSVPAKNRRRHGSILVQILPYIEQQSLFDSFNFKKKSIDGAVFSGTTKKIGSEIIKTYLCPSDGHDGLFKDVAVHNYAASNGPTQVYENPACSCVHQWKSFEMAPIDKKNNYAGPFTRLGVSTKPRRIADGISKTIFVGEARVPCSVHTQAGWAFTNNGSGYSTTLIPINFDTCNESASDTCHRPCTWNTDVGFKSAHPGGAQFLFGDGSVHFLKESLDHQSYQYLGAKADGQIASLD
jgi:prepilin-type N-terminal cleavage/methylation domain-containing protein/prepilin-type processing-associated H-X9-DG protein